MTLLDKMKCGRPEIEFEKTMLKKEVKYKFIFQKNWCTFLSDHAERRLCERGQKDTWRYYFRILTPPN